MEITDPVNSAGPIFLNVEDPETTNDPVTVTLPNATGTVTLDGVASTLTSKTITSPAHYKVCEGLDVVDMIRAVLTPEQFSGYCLGNVIKYRMRAGKKTMSPMEDLGKAHVYEEWLRELEGGED